MTAPLPPIDSTTHQNSLFIPVKHSTLLTVYNACAKVTGLNELSIRLFNAINQQSLLSATVQIPCAIFNSCIPHFLKVKIKHVPVLYYLIQEQALSTFLISHSETSKELLNLQNKRKNTALHYASRKGLYTVAQTLIQNNADVNSKNNSGTTPLHNSVIKNHAEITRLLVNSNADFYAQNSSGFTPGMFGKYLRSHKIKGSYTEGITKELYYRNILGNLFEIDGESSCSDPNYKLAPIQLEGGYMYYFLHLLNKVMKTIPNQDSLNLISEILNFSIKIKTSSPEDILKRLQSGKITLIPAGFKKHRLTLLIYPKYTGSTLSHYRIATSNRGALSEKPVEFTTIKSEKLSTHFIKIMLNLVRLKEADYLAYTKKYLWTPLERYQTEEDKALEDLCTLGDQYAKNCSWISSVTTIWAFYALQNEGLAHCKEKTDSIYYEVLKKTQEHVIKKYHHKHTVSTLIDHPIDKRIIRKIFSFYINSANAPIQLLCSNLLQKKQSTDLGPVRRVRRTTENSPYVFRPY